VPVQRARLHVERSGQPTHGEVGQAEIVEDAECRLHDIVARVPPSGFVPCHILTIVNTVQVNSVQVRIPQ